MKEELMDIYDENKNLTGKTIKRKDIDLLNDDEYIITVHCFIINSSNQILLTQRSLNQNRAGKWEDTHGGLQAGENSVLGIKRELKEEIGIDIQTNELKLIKTLKRKNKFKDIYMSVFKIEKNYTKEQIIEMYLNSWQFAGGGTNQGSQGRNQYGGFHP